MATLQGPTQTFGGGVSDVHTTPFPHALGTKARDSAGNEYIYVDYSAPASPEMLVTIDESFIASPFVTASWGRIGVVPDFGKLGQSENTPTMPASYQWTSDNAGWVQIYGRAYIGTGTEDASASDEGGGTTLHTSAACIFVPPTSVVTPTGTPNVVAGLALSTSGQQYIVGMWVATDASLGTVVSGIVGSTAGSSNPTNVPSWHAGGRTPVFLNYPYVAAASNPSNA